MAGFERRRWLRALLVAALVAAGAARAEGDEGTDLVALDVTILRVSDEPGEVDPRVERIDRLLRGQIAYQSLSIVDTHHRDVPMNEVWKFSSRPVRASSSGPSRRTRAGPSSPSTCRTACRATSRCGPDSR